MSSQSFIAGPWGAVLAIFSMTVATYLCRISGVVLMSRVRITRRIEQALRALPGSIIIATILPITVEGGASAMLALGATVVIMRFVRIELAALAAGLAALTFARALGI